jgi:hypothetical protein
MYEDEAYDPFDTFDPSDYCDDIDDIDDRFDDGYYNEGYDDVEEYPW